MMKFLLVVGILLFNGGCAFSSVNDDDAIDAIVGEASNQSYDTMVCVAQAIRHRGNLRGVYGFHAKHNKGESADTWEMAESAWEDSVTMKDRVHGAKNWGDAHDMIKIHRMVNGVDLPIIKAACGDLYFY
jgi:hypothetical protein